MQFYNAKIFTPDGFVNGAFRVENGLFTQVGADAGEKGGQDLRGATVLPGLVDIHIHGCAGADFSDGDLQGLETMAAYLARHGVTSFAPTSMSLPYESLEAAFACGAVLHGSPKKGCARVMGIHMEGPFLAAEKKGAQNGAYLRPPDFGAFRELYDGCGGLIRIVDAAPELPEALSFARQAGALCRVSAAHTAADYRQAAAFFDAGASHVTHLFNAMSPIHHRQPGLIGAASERAAVNAELICDGLHVHPSAVRMAFRLFPGRICLVSDALRCCGMPDGEYLLSGQRIILRDREARLADGSLAGSAVTLFDCLQRAVAFGIPQEEAIRAATIHPARAIGADGEIGSIEAGKRADFLVCDGELNLRQVYIGGEAV